jgi:hypothetical protein
MAKKAFVYDGTNWIDIAQSTTDLSNYANLTTNQPSFRNFIINGGMDIAQRGSSLTRGGTTDYGLDRWYASGFGSGQNFTVSRSTATPPTGFQYFQRVASTTTSSTNIFISQSLETSSVVPMQNRTATFSFRYRVPVNFTGTWTAQVSWSTATDGNLTPGATKTILANKTLSNTTSWTADSLTFTVPATATSLAVEFIIVNNVVNGAQFDFTGVQLELGSIPTPFERRPIGLETSLCQRYFARLIDPAGSGVANGATSSGVSRCSFSLPSEMRVNPTSISVSGTWQVWNGITVQTATYAGINFSNKGSLELEFNLPSAYPQGQAIKVYITGSASKYVDVSAEL